MKKRASSLELLTPSVCGLKPRHHDRQELPDGVLLEVVHRIGDTDGGTRDGWTLPGHFLIHASGGPLPYPVTLEVRVHDGTPRCVRYVAEVPEPSGRIQARPLRDHLPLTRLLHEALPMVMRDWDYDMLPPEYRGLEAAPLIAALLLVPGGPGPATAGRAKRGEPSDERLQQVAEAYRTARALVGPRRAPTAARDALGMSRTTFHRLRVEAASKGYLTPQDWPEGHTAAQQDSQPPAGRRKVEGTA